MYKFYFLFAVHRAMDIKNRPRIPIPDEDPYSIAGNGSGSSGSSGFAGGSVAATREQLLIQSQQHAQRRGDKPPKLPPRDMYHDIPKVRNKKINSVPIISLRKHQCNCK